MPDVRRVDGNLLVVLHAVLDEMNLTRAGERVGMTQPAVSGALARLRLQFNDQLLVRVGRAYELTPFAARLQPVVIDAVLAVERTLSLLPTFDAATSTRRFLISGTDYALSELTVPLLELLGERAPNTAIEFEGLPINRMVGASDLLRRDVIIAGTGRGMPGQRQSLFGDRFVCIADAAHPRLQDGSLSLRDLSELRHVVSTFADGASSHPEDMLAAAGITPRIGQSVHGFYPVPFLVSGSSLIAHVPERLALRYRDSLGLAIVDTPLAPATLIEAAHWHPSKSGDVALRWLTTMLRAAAELVEFPSGDSEVVA